MNVLGLRFCFRSTGHGIMHCQRCGGDRPYVRCRARRWFHVLNIPLIPLGRVIEHVQCRVCRTRYRLDLLAVPTVADMLTALPDGALASVTTMLLAGKPGNGLARSRAIEVMRAAGLEDYDDSVLTTDLAVAASLELDIAEPLGALASKLVSPAQEWFLADAVRVGLADGPLSERERDAVRRIAASLGMTGAQADGVIVLTEESAAAG